jgi:hypothetical protein
MIKWQGLDGRLSAFMADKLEERRLSTVERVHAWNAAQEHFASHTALEKTLETQVNRDLRTVDLPPDFLEVGMVYDPTNTRFLYKAKFQNGTLREVLSEANEFWIWGGKLMFERTVSLSERIVMYYYAHWPKVIMTGDIVTEGDILVPQWSVAALMHLTSAFLLHPSAIQSAMSREYNIMIDSGTPIMNSRMQQAWEDLRMYAELVSKHTPQDRRGGVASGK